MFHRKTVSTTLTALALAGMMAAPASAHHRPTRCSDCDRDGMTDTWEIANGLDPTNRRDARGDLDGDRLPNWFEFRLKALPGDEDSDDDGIDDGDERWVRGWRLAGADANGNGVVDGDDDHNRNQVDNEDEDDRREDCNLPDDDDTDDDGLDDEDENDFGTDPAVADSDGDGRDDGDDDADADGVSDEDADDELGVDRDADGEIDDRCLDDGEDFGDFDDQPVEQPTP